LYLAALTFNLGQFTDLVFYCTMIITHGSLNERSVSTSLRQLCVCLCGVERSWSSVKLIFILKHPH